MVEKVLPSTRIGEADWMNINNVPKILLFYRMPHIMLAAKAIINKPVLVYSNPAINTRN